MKVKINGFEIEGNPEEIKELIKMEDKLEKEFDLPEHKVNYKIVVRPKTKDKIKKAVELAHEQKISYTRAYKQITGIMYNPDGKIVKIMRRTAKKMGLNPEDVKHHVYGNFVDFKKVVELAHNKQINYTNAFYFINNRVPNGDEHAILREMAKKMGLNPEDVKYKHIKEKGVVCDKEITVLKDKVNEIKRVRIKNIQTRIKNLIYSDKGMSYDKAYEIARNEYDQKNNYGTITAVKGFPKFNTIKPEFHKILEDVTNNVINNKGTISFVNDAYIIGINDVRNWAHFLVEFMRNAQDICGYFNKPNLFKSINGCKIVYGGDQ